MQKHDVPNRNGRTYPEKILKREAERYKKIIEKGLSTSELNHPESSLIDLDRVSHLITEVWWDSNILMGKLLLLTSPAFHERGIVSTKGDIAANLMRQGVSLGISSRGVGSLKKVRGEKMRFKMTLNLFALIWFHHHQHQGHIYSQNKEDRHKYDEKLEEEKKIEPVSNVLKLMSKLDSYLK